MTVLVGDARFVGCDVCATDALLLSPLPVSFCRLDAVEGLAC